MKRAKTQNIDLLVPPNDFDSEVYILGQAMTIDGAIHDIDGLSPEMFYNDKHKILWDVFLQLKASQTPINIISVSKYLRDRDRMDEVGIDHILKLGDYAGAGFNMQYHISIIKETFVRRKAYIDLHEAMKLTYDQTIPIATVFDGLSKNMADCSDIVHGQSGATFEAMVSQEVQRMEQAALNDVKVSGVETGNYKLNGITGGWQKTDLIILAGRPGSGKTTRVINFAAHAAAAGKMVAMFSLEMSARQYIKKMLNDMTGIFIKRMNSGELNKYDLEKIKASSVDLAKRSIYLDDRAAVSPGYIKSKLWNLKRNKGLDLVVVDYLQLMAPDFRGHSRDADVGSISMGLKSIAKELDVPVIALSQLSRKCEERTDKRPILSDLRESGSIEQDADMVMAMYRPSYYYSLDKDRDYNNDVTDADYYRRISELHILKHRNGEADTFLNEFFYGELSRFTSDYEQQQSYQPISIDSGDPF